MAAPLGAAVGLADKGLLGVELFQPGAVWVDVWTRIISLGFDVAILGGQRGRLAGSPVRLFPLLNCLVAEGDEPGVELDNEDQAKV